MPDTVARGGVGVVSWGVPDGVQFVVGDADGDPGGVGFLTEDGVVGLEQLVLPRRRGRERVHEVGVLTDVADELSLP